MSKKSIGTGITRLLFGLKGKDLKVIPFNEMSPQQFEELDRFLGKLGFILASDDYKLTTKQANYVINQIKQLDLYRERIMPGKKPDFKDFIPRENLGIPSADKAKEFKGFKPKVIEGGKDKTRPGKIDYDKMGEFLGVKLRGDETFEELLEIEKRMKGKDPEKFAGGGVPGLLAKLRAKFGKKAITTADKIDRPAKAKLADEFKNFNERNRPLTEDELEDFAEEIGDNIEAYDLPQTVAERDKILKDMKDYEAEMFRQYKSGELDKYVNPDVLAKQKLDFQKKIDGVIDKAYDEVAGGAGFSSGDTKYDAEILRDSIYEQMRPGKDISDLPVKQRIQLYDSAYKYLTMIKPKKTLESIKKTGSIDISDPAIASEFEEFMKRTDPEGYEKFKAFVESIGRTKQAKGGLATMFRPKREEFIFGGGVGFKNLIKSIGKKQGIKGSDVLKQGNPKSQVPKRAKPFVSPRDMEDMKQLRIQQLENQLELLKTGRSLLANRDNFPPQFREVGDDMVRMMMPDEMRQMLEGSTVESLDREILQIENVLKNLKVGKDKRALNADGGLATMFRPRLKDGGPPNPGRRTFMKLMAGLASIPIVGKLFKPAAKVSTVVPLKNTTTEMPDWFPSFIEKVTTRNVGNKIDADMTLFRDDNLPGITVTKYDDGRISVNGENEYYAQYDIDYTPPGYELVDEKTGKAVKTQGEFEAVDSDPIPDYDGSIGDYEPRILDDVDEVMSSDIRRMEAYTTGKNEKDIPIKSGEGRVIENEVRADQAADYARENYDGPEDFAKGGLATMFKKK